MSVTFSAPSMPLDLAVNMSNGSAQMICEALGIALEPDWFGEMDAADFTGRVLLALAITPQDEGMPSYELLNEPGKARFIQAARRPGYMQERLLQLHDVAQWAMRHGVQVLWG